MYKAIHLISAIIRYFLPNPYINWFSDKNLADGFNILIGGAILGTLSYLLTKCGYTKGVDDPASGSAGYLISYCYLTALITLLGKFVINIKLAIFVFGLLYIISCIIVFKVFRRQYNF